MTPTGRADPSHPQGGPDAATPPPRLGDAAPHKPEPHHSLLGDIHASTLALRKRLASAHAFRDRSVLRLVLAAGGLLLVLFAAPLANRDLAPYTERLLTIGALVFLIAAPGYWLNLGHRALLVSGAVVAVLYAATAWIGSSGQVHDLFVVARVLAFLIFGLAGFNLVFVMEEMIYDAHRLLPHRRRGLLALPLILDAALIPLLPLWKAYGGLDLPTFWIASIVTTVLLAGWWFIRLVNGLDRRQLVIRELHLFVAGILAATLLADAVQYLVEAEAFLSTVAVYITLLATWVYVSYTTLQRTHLLLRGRNAAPWAAILLAGMYAIVAHGQTQYLASATDAVQDLFEERMAFMIPGIWIGVAFYVSRGAWRALRTVGELRTLPPRGRAVAEQAARLAKGVLATEHVVGEAARSIYLGLDKAIPGPHKTPPPPPRGGWELDEERVARLDEGDE